MSFINGNRYFLQHCHSTFQSRIVGILGLKPRSPETVILNSMKDVLENASNMPDSPFANFKIRKDGEASEQTDPIVLKTIETEVPENRFEKLGIDTKSLGLLRSQNGESTENTFPPVDQGVWNQNTTDFYALKDPNNKLLCFLEGTNLKFEQLSMVDQFCKDNKLTEFQFLSLFIDETILSYMTVKGKNELIDNLKSGKFTLNSLRDLSIKGFNKTYKINELPKKLSIEIDVLDLSSNSYVIKKQESKEDDSKIKILTICKKIKNISSMHFKDLEQITNDLKALGIANELNQIADTEFLTLLKNLLIKCQKGYKDIDSAIGFSNNKIDARQKYLKKGPKT